MAEEALQESARGKEISPRRKRRWLRVAVKSLLAFIVVVFLLPALLYIPSVQTFLKDYVSEVVSGSTGYEVGIGRFSLKFPFRLSLEDVIVLDEHRDTLVAGKEISLNVALLPLAKGDVVVKGIAARQAYYRMSGADSSLVMTARLNSFDLRRGKVDLLADKIELSEASVRGADVALQIDSRLEKPEPQDTAAPLPWLITLDRLQLSDVRYRMSMMPVIDSLDTRLPKGEVEHLSLNMRNSLVRVESVGISGLDAAYFAPDSISASRFMAGMPEVSDSVEASAARPWTILADRLRVDKSSALYATKGAVPLPGLDFSYLQLNDISIGIDNFYTRGPIMRVPITGISATERSGLALRKLEGLFEMDGRRLSVDRLHLATDASTLSLDAMMEMSAFSGNENAAMEVGLASEVGLADVERVMPFLKPLWGDLGRRTAEISVSVSGTPKALSLKQAGVKIPGIVRVGMKGDFNRIFDDKARRGNVRLDGSLTGGDYLKSVLGLDDIRIPKVQLSGTADYRNGTVAANMKAVADGGKLLMDGNWNLTREGYRGVVDLSDFDLRAILPAGPVGLIDSRITMEGKGYDPYRLSTTLEADLRAVEYDSVVYRNVRVDGRLDNGDCEMRLYSDNEFARADLALKGHISPDKYRLDIDGRIDNADFKAMRFTGERFSGGMNMHGMVYADVGEDIYGGTLRLSDLFVLLPGNTFRTDSIDVGFYSDTLRTHLRMRNNDLRLVMKSPTGIMAIGDSLARLLPEMDSIGRHQRVDWSRIVARLPQFGVEMQSGNKNILQAYLSGTGTSYKRLNLKLDKDSTLRFGASVGSLTAAGVTFDDIKFDGRTEAGQLLYRLRVENTPKNSEFLKMATVEGEIGGNSMTAFLKQTDRFDETGFSVGIKAEIADSVATVGIYPDNPVIAFRDWQLNAGNYASYDLASGKVKADISIRSGDHSYINIYTEKDGQFHDGMNLDLSGIELQDWLVMSPFAPPLAGVLSAQVKVNHNGRLVWGDGDVAIEKFSYGKKKVGDVHLNTKLALVGAQQKLYAFAGLDIDGRRFMTLRGYHNSDTVPEAQYNLDLKIDKFPMKAANAFLPDAAGQLSGLLNGSVKMTGTPENPVLDGYLQFDSAKIKLPAFGSELAFDSRRIPVDNGVVRFNEFGLTGANGNPVVVDGSVNLLPFDRIYTNLQIKGRNVQVVSGKKVGKSELYGKGFIDVNASVKGYLEKLDMRASLGILAGTNLTYVYQSSAMGLSEAVDNDMVKFVNFSDTTAVAADTLLSRPFAMRITAALIVQPNAVFTVNLSPDGKNKVQINGEGMLSFSQNYQGDMSLMGRYTVNDGFVRYSPPMMSEKNFAFQEGSSIAWTGDLLNPSVDISAVQSMKVNIGGGNQGSRVVPFDVVLKVGNTLSALDISFDLKTEGDMTIANELSGMSPEQRSTQAMNLLLYNTYTGGSTSVESSGNFSGNMAFSFLESMVNRWAASNISGIDLSFGIDQYDRTVDGTTSTTTSYSYKVSKSIFDDRFKIVVGGNYVSDASAEDNLAQNLLNDVSFEYKLNKTGTTYVKLFHHKEYESILEGEITETGAGFVWKRKIGGWKDMLRFLRPRKKIADKPETETK